MEKVTKQQNKFIQEYIKTLNGELSAKNAGYKSKDLKRTAEDLLSQRILIKEMKNQLQTQVSALMVNKGYVVHKLLQIAEFSLEEEDVLDKDGNYTGKKKLRDTSAGLKALDTLSRYLGLATKDSEENYVPAKIITIKNLNDDKI